MRNTGAATVPTKSLRGIAITVIPMKVVICLPIVILQLAAIPQVYNLQSDVAQRNLFSLVVQNQRYSFNSDNHNQDRKDINDDVFPNQDVNAAQDNFQVNVQATQDNNQATQSNIQASQDNNQVPMVPVCSNGLTPSCMPTDVVYLYPAFSACNDNEQPICISKQQAHQGLNSLFKVAGKQRFSGVANDTIGDISSTITGSASSTSPTTTTSASSTTTASSSTTTSSASSQATTTSSTTVSTSSSVSSSNPTPSNQPGDPNFNIATQNQLNRPSAGYKHTACIWISLIVLAV